MVPAAVVLPREAAVPAGTAPAVAQVVPRAAMVDNA